MYIVRIMAFATAAIMSGAVLAQPPYTISGMHVELTLSQAVAQAEKLGGACRVNVPGSSGRGKSVQCEYKKCDESTRAGGCEQEGHTGTGLAFSSYPISSISLMAPGDAAPLSQIVMVYLGDTETVATSLIAAFGPTIAEGAPTAKTSWSNARRWSWVDGRYHMGLLDSPPLIILGSDPARASVGESGPSRVAP